MEELERIQGLIQDADLALQGCPCGKAGEVHRRLADAALLLHSLITKKKATS
jgi:hypothetical protein